MARLVPLPRFLWLLPALGLNGCEEFVQLLVIMWFGFLAVTALTGIVLLAFSVRALKRKSPTVVLAVVSWILGLPIFAVVLMVIESTLTSGESGRVAIEMIVVLPWVGACSLSLRAARDTPTMRIVATFIGVVLTLLVLLGVLAPLLAG